MKVKRFVGLAVIGAIVVIGLVWFWPVHKANAFLAEISKLRPGITDAAQVELLSSRGLVKRVDSGCEHGVEKPHENDSHEGSATGDICYSFMFRNTIPRFLHLAPATGIYGTLTVKDRQLTLIKLTYQKDWLFFNLSDQACDSCDPNHSNYLVDRQLSGARGVPGNVHVYLTSGSSPQQRRDAYAINTGVLGSMGKAVDGRDLNSAIWSERND